MSRPRPVLAAVCLAALATLLFTATRAGTVRAASAVPKCSASGLVVWLDTDGNGAAGSIYYKLELTNLSGRPCTLNGYPGVSAVSLSGAQLGSPASRERPSSPRLVTLAAGATASAQLRIVEAGNFPASRCHQTTAAGLRVYPPGQSSAKTVPFPFEACARSGPVYLSVQPVRKS
ncbi:MAG TPA: DUF4232 domain-containing protein [Solirubrobacteraceae bacterium]